MGVLLVFIVGVRARKFVAHPISFQYKHRVTVVLFLVFRYGFESVLL